MSFINFNNRQAAVGQTYTAEMIAEALRAVETKNPNKIKSLTESIEEPITLTESLKLFTNKVEAMSALSNAFVKFAPVVESADVEDEADEEVEETETIDEAVGTIALGIMLAYAGIKVLKFVAKKVVGAVGMNLELEPAKLKEISTEVTKKVASETGSGANILLSVALKQEIDAKIDTGEIKTINDMQKAMEDYLKTNEAQITISKEDMEKLHNGEEVEIEGSTVVAEAKLTWDSLIEKISNSEVNEDWGSSDQSIMNKAIHKDAGSPKTMPSPFDSKLRAAAEDAVDFYWDEWEEYRKDRDGLIDNAVRSYLRSYFPKEWETMVRMFESNEINENYEVIFSDGVSQMKKFRSEAQAIDFMKKEIASNKKLRDIAVYKPGMHSTTQTELVVSFWGDGSYLDNVSKKDAKLAAKKLEESVVNEADMNDPVLVAFRAARMKREAEMAKAKNKRKPLYGKQREKAEDDLWQISQDLKDLYADRGTMLIDMEQEAEVEGGEIADYYGDKLNKIEDEIQTLIAKRNKLEMRLTESFELIDEGRSIAKIQKEWSKVTDDMKSTVDAWKTAEGKEKEDLLKKLKDLTATKKKLEFELDAAVGLKDADIELVGESEEDYSDEMTYGQLERCIDYATMLRERYEDGFTFDPWMHSAITIAKHELNSVYDAIDGDDGVVETKINEDLRSDLKSYIKKNQKELNRLADADNWDEIYGMLLRDFEVEPDTEDADELKTIFNMTF